MSKAWWMHYLQMQYFTERFQHAPSLLGLSSLRVIGDVWFGRDVVLQVSMYTAATFLDIHLTAIRQELS